MLDELVQADRALSLKMLGKRGNADWFLLNVSPYVRYSVNVPASLHNKSSM